jgi:hypothetical protein
LVDVVDTKCDVSEPALVCSRQIAFDQLIVAEDFERRPVIAIPGQAKMNSAKMRIWNRVHSVEPRSGQVSLRPFGFASEHVAIESDEPFPISGDQIRVHVFRADWHSPFCICERAYGKRKAMRGRIALLKHFVRNTSRLGVVLRSFGSAHASSRRFDIGAVDG